MANTIDIAFPTWLPDTAAEGHSHHAEALPWGWSLIFLIAMPWLTVTRARVIVEREWCELFMVHMERTTLHWRIEGTWRGHRFAVECDNPAGIVAEMWRLRRTVG